jgi:hypothetical protein
LFFAVALLFGIFFVRSFYKSVDVANVLSTLPKEDRESLEWLFRGFSESSYVLFGNKPMAFNCVRTPYHPKIDDVLDLMESLTHCFLGNLVEIKGLNAWKKYEHLFPSSDFIFLENCDSDLTTIYLINKRLFLQKVKENIDYFKDVLGANTTPQKVLDDCLKSDDLIKDGLKDHDGLLGILLGFGRHNAHLFWRRGQIGGMEGLLPKKSLVPSPGYSTVDEERHHIDSMLTSFDGREMKDFNPHLLGLPGFAADLKHPETRQLKIEYRKQYKKIVKEYKNGDYLEVTLKQFCNHNS